MLAGLNAAHERVVRVMHRNRVLHAERLHLVTDEWRAEIPLVEEWFAKIGEKVPTTLRDELANLKQRLG